MMEYVDDASVNEMTFTLALVITCRAFGSFIYDILVLVGAFHKVELVYQ